MPYCLHSAAMAYRLSEIIVITRDPPATLATLLMPSVDQSATEPYCASCNRR